MFGAGLTYAQSDPSPSASSTEILLPEVRVQAEGDAAVTENTDTYTAPQVNTATRLNLSPRETPQSVTVITRQRIEDQGLNTLGAVLTQTPGISANNNSGTEIGGRQSYFYSRGYQLDSYQLDGALAPSTAFGEGISGNNSLDTALYDSVTVVRGATGLLTGAGDPAGSINLVRKRPTRQFQASVEQGFGRWNKSRTVADIASPLSEAGTLRGRFVAAYDEGDAWQDRYKGYKRLAYGVLEADIGPATEISFALEHSDQKSHGGSSYSGFEIGFPDGSKTPFSNSDNNTTNWSTALLRQTSASLALAHRFNEDWRARLSYTHGRMEYAQKYGKVENVTPDGQGTLMLRKYDTEYRTEALDASLEGRFTLWGRQHDLVAGFNGYSSRTDSPYFFNTFNAVGRFQVLPWDGRGVPEPDWASIFSFFASQTMTQQHGVFAALRLRPANALSVILGGRVSTWETRAKNTKTGAVTDNRKENNVFTPYAGLVYDLNPNISAYASYTSIFKPQSNKDAEGSLLDPEEGENYELGLKSEWFNKRL